MCALGVFLSVSSMLQLNDRHLPHMHGSDASPVFVRICGKNLYFLVSSVEEFSCQRPSPIQMCAECGQTVWIHYCWHQCWQNHSFYSIYDTKFQCYHTIRPFQCNHLISIRRTSSDFPLYNLPWRTGILFPLSWGRTWWKLTTRSIEL